MSRKEKETLDRIEDEAEEAETLLIERTFEPAGFVPDPHEQSPEFDEEAFAVQPVEGEVDLPLEAFQRFTPQILRGIDIWLAGATWRQAGKMSGVSAAHLSRCARSPLGQQYIAQHYNSRRTYINSLYTKALLVHAEAMDSAQPMSNRLRAAENLLKHFNISEGGDARPSAINASDLAQKIVAGFMSVNVNIDTGAEAPHPVIEINKESPKDESVSPRGD